jgi:hypothetical protein
MNYEPVLYTPVYNDAEALAKSAEKMKDLGWKRLVIDGRYHGFERVGDSDISTDDTRKVCEEYGFEYKICTPCYEEEKFNFACMSLASSGHKVMALCSADEWYTVTFKAVAQKWIDTMCDEFERPMLFKVAINEIRKGHMYSQNEPFLAKIFYNLDKIENKHVHWATYVKQTGRVLKAYPQEVPSVILHHDNHMRSEERDDLMIAYQDKNITRESPFLRKVSRDKFYL